MLLPRIISALVSVAFMAPLAWIFYLMIRNPLTTDEELHGYQEEFESSIQPQGPNAQGIDSDGEHFLGASMSSEVTHVITPFSIIGRWLQFGPRRSVGYVGLLSVATLLVCLVWTALFPSKVWSSEDIVDRDGGSEEAGAP